MVQNFNENRFLVDENGKKREVEVPFDLMLGEKRYENSPNSSEGSYFKGGIYHYQKFFDVNVSACNDYFALHFWGAYRKATVLINDDKLKINKNGFNDFYVEFKAKEHNKIDVIVDNSLIPNCRWYTGSGIYRDVELIHKKKNEIKRVFVKTLDYKTRKLAINVDSNAPYVYEIYDETNLIYKGSEKIISLDNLKLWNLNSPKLYSLIVKSENDEVQNTKLIEANIDKSFFTSSLEFSSDDFIMNRSLDRTVQIGTDDSGHPVNWRFTFPAIEGMSELMWATDWAYTTKTNGHRGNLVMDANLSRNLMPMQKLVASGFPVGLGVMDGSQQIDPISVELTTSRRGLANNGCILHSRGTDHGNSGGPIFAVKDGKYG